MAVTLDEAFEIFNIPTYSDIDSEGITYDDRHDAQLALALAYYFRYSSKLGVSRNEFLGCHLKDNDIVDIIRTAFRVGINFPVNWNSVAIEALRMLMTNINYHQVSSDIIDFSNF